MKKEKELIKVETALEDLAEWIRREYHENTLDWGWTDGIGSIMTVKNTAFYTLSEMLEIIRTKPTPSQLFDYIEQRESRNAVTLKTFLTK